MIVLELGTLNLEKLTFCLLGETLGCLSVKITFIMFFPTLTVLGFLPKSLLCWNLAVVTPRILYWKLVSL